MKPPRPQMFPTAGSSLRSYAWRGARAVSLLLAAATAFTNVNAANPCLNAPTEAVTDPAGDQNTPQPAQLDIRSVSVGEDYTYIGQKRLVFVVKVTNLTTVPANGIWRARWTYTPVGGTATTYYVAMLSDDQSAVRFEYGTQSGSTVTTVGTLQDSSYTNDGTITLVVNRSSVGNPPDGAMFTAVNGVTQSNIGGGLFTGVDSTSNGPHTPRAPGPSCPPRPGPAP